MELPSKTPENVNYSSADPFREFGEGDTEEGRESITEELRPSEETLRIGENFLSEEINEKIVKFYKKIFDEKLEGEEKVGIPANASAKAKALHVKNFLRENPGKRNRVIETFPEEGKEEYFKIIDLGEIKAGLGEENMSVEIPFLLYDYLRGKYNKINNELRRELSGEERAKKEAEKDSVFNALKDLTTKLSDRDVEGTVSRRMGEGREEYIGDRLLNPDNISTAEQDIKEEIMQREWGGLAEGVRNNYIDFNDFCSRRIDELRGKLGDIGSGLSDQNILALLRRNKTDDISIERGFFGGTKGVRFGAKKISVKDFADFANRENTIFEGSVKNRAGEMLGRGWDQREREEQEQVIKGAFRRLTPEDIRNSCNRIREKKMQNYWERNADNINREDIEKYKEEDRWVDVASFFDSFFNKKYTGDLEKDANEMLSVLKNKKIIDNDFLDLEDFLSVLKKENPKIFTEKEYRKNYKDKKKMLSLAFTVLESATREQYSFNDLVNIIIERGEDLEDDEKKKFLDLLDFYEKNKKHKYYRVLKAMQRLDKLRERGGIKGDIVEDKQEFFNIFIKENIIERGGALSKKDDFYNFLGEMTLTGIIDKEYKDCIKDEKKFLIFSVELIDLIEKKQS